MAFLDAPRAVEGAGAVRVPGPRAAGAGNIVIPGSGIVRVPGPLAQGEGEAGAYVRPLSRWTFDDLDIGPGGVLVDVEGGGSDGTPAFSPWLTGQAGNAGESWIPQNTGAGVSETVHGTVIGNLTEGDGKQFTIVHVFNPGSLTGGRSMMRVGPSVSSVSWRMQLVARPELNIMSPVNDTDQIRILMALDAPALTVGVWTFVALRYDGTQVQAVDRVTWNLNGSWYGARIAGTPPIPTDSDIPVKGGSLRMSGGGAAQRFDETAFWPSLLTDDGVDALYSKFLAGDHF